jgi:hypothetical protein
MMGGHKTLYHEPTTRNWVIYLRVNQLPQLQRVKDGWFGWMVGWMVGRQKHFSIGSTLTQGPQMYHEGWMAASGTRKHFFPIGLTYTPKLSQLVHGKGLMISGWESLFPLGCSLCLCFFSLTTIH